MTLLDLYAPPLPQSWQQASPSAYFLDGRALTPEIYAERQRKAEANKQAQKKNPRKDTVSDWERFKQRDERAG